MARIRTYSRIVLSCAFVLALVPGFAFAASDTLEPGTLVLESVQAATEEAKLMHSASTQELLGKLQALAASQINEAQTAFACNVAKAQKLLSYDPAALAAIGTQESTGHSICCPSFACAFADAVIDGTIHDHGYYSCSCCTWTDWGGGDSSDRCVGSDEQLLREAYDQISAGKPTVIHVSWSGGEHWIALIGYENATDPDHLTLSNFIALDPWDGAQLNAGSKYSLYGDGCEHISER